MASGRLIFSAFVDHNVMWLDRIPLFSDRPSAGRYFLLSVDMQVLWIFLVVPIDPAIEQVLSALLFAIPSVYILSIVKLFQTPVVPALLLHVNRMGPVIKTRRIDELAVWHLMLLHHSQIERSSLFFFVWSGILCFYIIPKLISCMNMNWNRFVASAFTSFSNLKFQKWNTIISMKQKAVYI